MIKSMDEFIKEYSPAVIVNYDMAKVFDGGRTYRTSTNSIENFKKDRRGKYIEYPSIQPYLSLENSSYRLFIIHDAKVYELGKGSKDNTYNIVKEVTNIDFDISNDDVFYKKGKDPVIVSEEDYTIVK